MHNDLGNDFYRNKNAINKVTFPVTLCLTSHRK